MPALLLAGLGGALQAQQKPGTTDASSCVDSKVLPKLPSCRIDICERRDSDQRTVTVREDDKGDPVTAALDGQSRSIMYECAEGTTPGSIVQQAATALRAAGIPVLYQFVGLEGAVTARKDDLWILVDAASNYYTLTELAAAPPEFEMISDAAGFADAIERYGHVPVYAFKFQPGRAELTSEASAILREVAIMLEAHPDWRIRVEGHTDNTGTKLANLTLSARRAAAVVTALTGAGVKRMRLDSSGLGDTRPVAANTTEEGRAKNRRIELVKVSAQQ